MLERKELEKEEVEYYKRLLREREAYKEENDK